MLIVKKSFNFDDFEINLREAKKERQIRLPSQLKHIGSWGNEVALIQLLLTWERVHDVPEIKTYVDDGSDSRGKQLDDLGKRLFGIAALYLAKQVVTSQDSPIPKQEYAKHCAGLLKIMDECDIHSSESVNRTYPRNLDKIAAQFISLHGSRYEFLRSLYNAPSRKETLNRVDFGAMVHSAFGQNTQFARHLSQDPNLKTGLANLMFELFQNTNDHAYEMFDGRSFLKNIRAISIKSHSDMLERTDLGGMKAGQRHPIGKRILIKKCLGRRG